MDFSLSKKEILFQQMIRAFAEKEVKPLAAEVDEEERFPVETVEKMAKLGIMGIPFPVEYGGAGGDNVLYSMAVEELSRVCATTGVIVSAHTSLCASPIYEFGNEEQRKKYFGPVEHIMILFSNSHRLLGRGIGTCIRFGQTKSSDPFSRT